MRIPFRLTAADNLVVRATLNGVDDVDLMFHTAFSGVALTKTATAKLASFRADGAVDVKSWGGTASARRSGGNALRIGALERRGLEIFEDEFSGSETDGKFGPDLFSGRAFVVDFDAREIVVSDALPALDERHRLELSTVAGAMAVVGEISVGDVRFATPFMVHTGFGGTALLDEELVREHGLETRLEIAVGGALKDAYGNEVKTRKARLPSLRFGATAFENVSVGLFPGRIGGVRTSVLGTGLLKRFNLHFDAERRSLYAVPNRAFALPF